MSNHTLKTILFDTPSISKEEVKELKDALDCLYGQDTELGRPVRWKFVPKPVSMENPQPQGESQ